MIFLPPSNLICQRLVGEPPQLNSGVLRPFKHDFVRKLDNHEKTGKERVNVQLDRLLTKTRKNRNNLLSYLRFGWF